MTSTAVIGGDVWPTRIEGDDLARRLGLSAPPDLFAWTLDAAVAAGPRRPNYACLAFEPDHLSALALGCANVAVTASNHITDFGDAGAKATFEALAARGFQQVGAGMNRAEAEKPIIVELPAGRVAMLAFAETAPRVFAQAAGDATPGVVPCEEAACLRAIADARQSADWVWVILHWGEEFIRYPDPAQRALARKMVDAGASFVAAAHTHVTLGFEERPGGVIFYGLGNLVFPPYPEHRGFTYHWNPASRRGALAVGEFESGNWRWSARTIKLDARGLPRVAPHADCVDYGRTLPPDAASYAAIYPRLRQSERRKYCAQRILYMGWQERWARLRGAKAAHE